LNEQADKGNVESAEQQVDIVTVDLIENALRNARNEMDEVVFRTAMSSGIREQHDAFPLITDQQGRMIVGQFGSPVHSFLRSYKGSVNEGDVFLTSDPYSCEAAISHANDWLVVKPIFFEGNRIGWTAMFGHVTDIGGRVPGSMPTDARQIYEEGILIPPTKIVREGEPRTDLIDLIMHNCRVPQWNRADLSALVSSADLAERRVHEICRRFGVETYLATINLLLARNRKAIKELIDRAIPDETIHFEDYVDDDGLGGGPYKLACVMKKKNGRLVFDFTGTDPQSDGPINFYSSEAMFKMFAGSYLINIFDPQIVFNDGYYDLIDVHFPKGSLLNPIKPAALGCRTATLQRTFDVLIGLLGQRSPELMTAAGYSDAPELFFSGYDQEGKWFQLIYLGYGGIPGRPAGDGHDGSSLLPSFMNLSNEFMESYYPLLVECCASIPDSGGAGLHRGGNGVLLKFRFLEPGMVSIHDSRWLTYPWGVNGGGPGSRSWKKLVRADGSKEVLPAKADNIWVEPNDVLEFATWGGGGWGDPLERDPSLVALEVDRGLVTQSGALRYGVVLTDELEVDEKATGRLRDEMRENRGEVEVFDRGGALEELIAACEAETGLPPPGPPRFGKRGVLALQGKKFS